MKSTPEEHAAHAETLLLQAEGLPANNPHTLATLAAAQVHATLSLRGTGAPPRRRNADPKPAQKRAAKKTTTKEKSE